MIGKRLYNMELGFGPSSHVKRLSETRLKHLNLKLFWLLYTQFRSNLFLQLDGDAK